MVRKNHGSRYSAIGEPDLDIWLFFSKNQPFAIPIRIEVKRDHTDKPRPVQRAMLQRSMQHGVMSFVVWEIAQLEEMYPLLQQSAEKLIRLWRGDQN